jgi:catechol 2,3-dioxygenase-like lactoylglutathione lyase family enzyme
MIKGMHCIFYTPEAEAARVFIKDRLGFPHVDAGDGWLIFDVPSAEVAVHPGDDTHHQISFWCDDIKSTVQELQGNGVNFKSPITDQGFGLVTTFEMPGGVEVQLYEPKHPQP